MENLNFCNTLVTGCWKLLFIVAEFQRILNPVKGVRPVFLCFPNCCFVSHLFQVDWKTNMVKYFVCCSSYSKFVHGLWQLYLASIVYEKCEASLEVPETLSLPFLQVENKSPWEKKIMSNILDTIQAIFIKFNRIDPITSEHLKISTNDLENLDQGQIL